MAELRKGTRANANVRGWFSAVADDDLYLSVLVVGEIRRGIEAIHGRAPRKAAALEPWLRRLVLDHAERVLSVDLAVAEEWGRLSAVRTLSVVDVLLAATAMAHTQMPATQIALHGVGKRYGAAWAVRDVSLTIAPGEFFTLLGPSGCGKTTVLRMIAGFLEPDEGEILLDGQPRLAVLDRGQLVQIGTPAEVYRRPRSRFLAEFLGDANLLEGTVEAGGRRVRLTDAVALDVATAGQPVGARVLCVVRPEAVRLTPSAASCNGAIVGTVTSAVYLGGTWDCQLTLPGGVSLRARIPAAGGATAPQSGAPALVTVHPDDVIVLAA